ncbi:hypothetical protein BLA60_23595 [Actinophytocola xinjiangensis]|uniref:Peptidase inhibitor I9 n=1 Tax=Actinophytocola xinjiangensis TaxID=485602 RepID=A0A7Z1AXX5_9PSEU|nr:S8 family peptidase [Actinophytocola xinjiangensis]OLF08403.1 hypothetical protein BLA60_23595 [Actinophytocola xinjiangensis]
MSMKPHNGKQFIASVGVALLVATVTTVPARAAVAEESGYIVVLSAEAGQRMASATVSSRAAETADRFDSTVEHTYTAALSGFSLSLTAAEAAELAAEPGVADVVRDGKVKLKGAGEQLNPPSWGLDRIDQRVGLDGKYRYPNKASSVTAYVIDTGIAPHNDFGDRVQPGVDLVDGDDDPLDGNGHGTFVSGIIGGEIYGVAKKIKIVPVRVLNDQGSGTYSGVIAGIDWVTQNAVRPAVANMSLGGSANTALDSAVRGAIAAGIPFTVPAGSSATDASNFSPARVAEAMTIGATGSNDCVAPQSNYGAVLDMYAPGLNITGPWLGDGDGSNTISGSSFAAAHVAGAVGMYLHAHPNATPGAVSAALVAAASDVVCNVPPNTPNKLLYVWW